MSSTAVSVCCAVFLLSLSAAPPLTAQAPDAPAQVLVLGTYHFANPCLDMVQTEVADVLAPAKQAAIHAE